MSLKLELFGRPLAYLNGKRLAEYKFKKPFALLCYLIIKNQPIPRIKLASIFWPDHSEKNGLMNLRKALGRLKKQVGEHIGTNYHEAWFNSSLPYHLDLINLSKFKQLDSDAEVDAFIALHRGDFLEGLYLRNAEPFEKWAAIQAETFREDYLKKLIAAAQRFDSNGEVQKAIKCGRKLLEIDPLRESAHQDMIRWYRQSGEYQLAIQQYETCRSILQKELNMPPTAATQKLYETIVTGGGVGWL